MSLSNRVRMSVSGMFGHGPSPLTNTGAYPGDTGLCGPGSISWQVIADVSVFVGAIRALLIQSAHPEVAAGVEDHSRYRHDPLGRLNRTAFYVTTATYGSMPEVNEAVELVRAAHSKVRGVSHRGIAYDASQPEFAAWVHNSLTDSFLVAYRALGPGLSDTDADRFVVEQARIGELLGAAPMPETAAELHDWVRYHPEIAPSPGMRNAVEFLVNLPVSRVQLAGYRVLLRGAVTTIPPELRTVLGLRARRGARSGAIAMTAMLRMMMRNSPAWQASLQRCGTPHDPKLFREPLAAVS